MSQVVTELVIDADTTGADTFSRAMAGAEQAAKSAVESITGINLGIAAVGISAAGAIVGISSFLDWITRSNKELADMQSTAKTVGLTLDQFQSMKFAAGASGVSDNGFLSGLQQSASLLNDAQRNVNSLSKLFDANGLSIKNSNGQLITENQLLGTAADLVKNAATPQDALQIAQMLGFTKEWVPLLQQGGAAMMALASEAAAAGLVIDSDTIAKAADFDAEWRKSSIAWSTYMKAALASVLPILDELIDGSVKFLKNIDPDAVAQPGLDAIRKAGVPESGELKIEFSDTVTQALGDFAKAVDQGSPLVDAISALGRALTGLGETKISASPYVPSSPAEFPSTSEFLASAGGRATAARNSGVVDAAAAAAAASNADATSIPAKEQANDVLDRAINTLERHTAQTVADTQAVGLGAGALAEYKAEAALMTAAQQNGTVVTQKMADHFQDLAQDAGDAAAALAKAKVASDIQFSSGTALLSAEDVKIAQQLKTIYGNDIPAALSSSEAAAIRFNDATRELSTSIQNDLVTGLTDIADGTKSAKQGFADLGLQVVKSLEQMIIKFGVVLPLAQSLQSALGGGGILSFLGLGGSGSGGVAGTIQVGGQSFPSFGFHTGGIVGAEPTFSRMVDPSIFAGARRFHTGGIVGADEEPIIARKGEGVFTPGQMQAMGGQNISIVYSPTIDSRGADSTAVAKLATVVAQDKRDFEKNVLGVVSRAKANNPAFR